MVTLQNYEEYIMLYVDEELDTASVTALMDFLAKHPELQSELALYQKTKLPPAEATVFAYKDALFKQSPKTFSLYRPFSYAIAAGVVLLIGMLAFQWMNKPDNNIGEIPPIVHEERDTSHLALPQIAIADTQTIPQKVENSKARTRALPLAKRQHLPAKIEQKIEQKKVLPHSLPLPENNVPINEKEEPQLAKAEEKIIEEILPETIPASIEPQTAAPAQKNKNWLARLPISSEKKQGLTHLKNNVESKLTSVKNIQNELKNTSLEVKLGNRELFVINL